MTWLAITGVGFCILLMAIAVFLTVHEHHPDDYFSAAALLVFALSVIALILNIRHILLAWFILAGIGVCCWTIYQNLWGRHKRAPEAGSADSST